MEFCNGGLLFFFALKLLGREHGFLIQIWVLLDADFEILYGCVSPYLAYKLLRSFFSLWQSGLCGLISAMSVCVSRHILPITGHTEQDQ